MTHNKLPSTFLRSINYRVGRLLYEERRRKDLSIDQLAVKVGLNSQEIACWEKGFSSPPANLYYKIIQFMGFEAFERAALLDMEFQFERNRYLTGEVQTLTQQLAA